MAVKVTLDGFAEFSQALGALPVTLADQARADVDAAAAATKTETIAGYPDRTGRMRAGVITVEDTSRAAVYAVEVRSTAPTAHLWEYGTQNRQTQKGWNRGAEPAHRDQSVISIAYTHGPAMQTQLAALVTGAGFLVTGGFNPD
jgi:hypothetical protein